MYLVPLTAAYFSRVGDFSIDSWLDRDDRLHLARILTVMVTPVKATGKRLPSHYIL